MWLMVEEYAKFGKGHPFKQPETAAESHAEEMASSLRSAMKAEAVWMTFFFVVSFSSTCVGFFLIV